MRTRHRDIVMTQGPLPVNLLRFALPVMLSGLLQLAFNATDVIVVGRCAGDTALAAVTSSSPLVNMLINAFTGFAMGTNVVVAQALGRRDEKYVERAVHACVLLGVLLGLAIGAVGFVFTPALLRLMDTPDTVIGEAVVYLRIYFLGVPAMTTYNFGASVLRASGDTRRPMNFLIVSGVLNLVLNLLFVLGFDMGVAGVAWGTFAANGLSCVLVLRCLTRENDCRHLELSRLHMDGEILTQVLRIGTPASLQAVLMAMSAVVIQSGINSFGDVVMAGSGASSNIEGFVWTAMFSFYQACLTFTGSNLGAKQMDRVDKVLVHCLWMVTAAGLLVGGGVCLFGKQLLGLYTESAQAVEYGLLRMFIVCLPYFLYGMCDVVIGSMRGMGRSVPPMISSLICLCVFRLAWMAAVFPQYPTQTVLYICFPISWLLLLIVNLLCWVFVRNRVRAKVAREQEAET